MDAVEAQGNAIEVGSNFFLFFSSQLGSATAMMPGMPGMTMAPPRTTATARRTEPKPEAQRQSGQ
jgi:hypothetical protein